MLTMSRDLLYYKLHPEVKEPYRATEGSACFDLYSFLQEDKPVKVYLNQFEEVEIKNRLVQSGRVQVNPNERVLIPTGLIFDIPKGYSVRLYPRSSLALKQGLTLANNVGIIDWDYVEPLYVMMTNISQSPKSINNGNRICQAELVERIQYDFIEAKKPPVRKTERDGGFGSTGK